ncbi:hypothetical protein V5785_22800, partial [Bacillus subtilis]
PNTAELHSLLERVGLRSVADANSFHVGSPPNWRFLANDDQYFDNIFEPLISALNLSAVSGFSELQVRARLQIVRDVLSGSAQYEHIQPLLGRIDSLKDDFSKVVAVGPSEKTSALVTVISLRECKQDVKKILPIL